MGQNRTRPPKASRYGPLISWASWMMQGKALTSL
jgi:hypothetical protein